MARDLVARSNAGPVQRAGKAQLKEAGLVGTREVCGRGYIAQQRLCPCLTAKLVSELTAKRLIRSALKMHVLWTDQTRLAWFQ